jgi:hypothetical protein
MADFIPKRDGDRVTFLHNLRSKLPQHAKALNVTPAQIKEVTAQIDVLIADIAMNEQKRAEYQATVRQTEANKNLHTPALRRFLRFIKAHPAYTDSIGADLGIRATQVTLAPDSVQPALTAVVRSDAVRLNFKKGRVDGVNIYTRLAGEPSWTFLARDHQSPYDDRRPVQKPGVAERREYHARALRGDSEIGAPSPIVSVLVA